MGRSRHPGDGKSPSSQESSIRALAALGGDEGALDWHFGGAEWGLRVTGLSLDCAFPREQLGKAVLWAREVTLAPQDLLESKDCLEQLERKGPRSVRAGQRGGAGGLGGCKKGASVALRGQGSLFTLWLIPPLHFRVILVPLGPQGRMVLLV